MFAAVHKAASDPKWTSSELTQGIFVRKIE